MRTIVALLLGLSSLYALKPETVTIIYTNNLHGELLPVPDWTVPGDPKPELGGIDRLATVILKERRTGPCLVVDAGDFIAGSPEANRTRGMIIIQLFNILGYDAVCVGERDIPFITEKLDTIARYARFRLLGERALSLRANVDMPVTRPSLLKEIDGIRIGLIGILDPDLFPHGADTSLITAGLSPEQILNQELKSLRSQNAEIIIVLAHMALERCRQLAARFPDVTLFICGHEGWITEPSRATAGGFPLVLQAGRRGQRVGICQLFLDTLRHQPVSARARTVNLLSPHAESDSTVRSLIAGALLPKLDDSLTFSPLEITPAISEYAGYSFWIAEQIAAAAKTAVIIPFTSLDWALLKGPVTERSLRRITPFDEPLVRAQLSESQIAAVLDELLQLDSRHLPAAAGIAYDVAHPDSSHPQLPARALNIRTRIPQPAVLLPRWLAVRSGAPSRSCSPVKETFADFLIQAVKTRGIRPELIPAPPVRQTTQPSPSGKININTATSEELQTLPGIGPAFASRIIQYRQQHGPFTRIEDLLKIKGLGEKRLARIRDKITI